MNIATILLLIGSREGKCPIPQRDGGLAERLRSGLQIREDRFDSGTRLQILDTFVNSASGAVRPPETAFPRQAAVLRRSRSESCQGAP